jgi:GntR family transcriptional regulator, transcriptional repressor for pyruvate dehydrogenase complex
VELGCEKGRTAVVTEVPEPVLQLSSDLTRAARPARQKVFEAVVEQLRIDILSGRRKVGSKLPRETDLAGQFGVSRTAIREALRVLEMQGLVYVYHGYGGGMFVKALDDQPLAAAFQTSLQAGRTNTADVYEARIVLEPMLTRLAIERGGSTLVDQLAANVERCHAVLDEAKQRSTLDMNFHFILADHAANPVLASIVRSLWTLVADLDERVLAPSSRSAVMATHTAHTEIVAAARRGEASLAERIMIAHLLSLRDYYTSQDGPRRPGSVVQQTRLARSRVARAGERGLDRSN